MIKICANKIIAAHNEMREFMKFFINLSCKMENIFSLSYESPRWLIQKGRIDEAHHVLKQITHWNGRNDVTNDMINEVIDAEKEVNSYFAFIQF